MNFDITRLKDLAEKLDYKPESQEHIDNLSNYCSSNRVIAICEGYAALEARLKELEASFDDLAAATGWTAEGVEVAIAQAFRDGIPVNRMQFIAKMTAFAAQLRQPEEKGRE